MSTLHVLPEELMVPALVVQRKTTACVHIVICYKLLDLHHLIILYGSRRSNHSLETIRLLQFRRLLSGGGDKVCEKLLEATLFDQPILEQRRASPEQGCLGRRQSQTGCELILDLFPLVLPTD